MQDENNNQETLEARRLRLAEQTISVVLEALRRPPASSPEPNPTPNHGLRVARIA